MFCSSCGASNKSAARFCSTCGQSIDTPPAAPAAESPVALVNLPPQPPAKSPQSTGQIYIVSDTSNAAPAEQPSSSAGNIVGFLFRTLMLVVQFALFCLRMAVEMLFAVFRAFF